MEAVVPHEITTELTQILANLVLGDNKIRSKCAIFSIRVPHAKRPAVQNRRSMIDWLKPQTCTCSHWLSSLLQLILKWQVDMYYVSIPLPSLNGA